MSDADVTEHGRPTVVARTHIGRRDNNEDQILADADIALYAVADGVGGHQAGEVASRITCRVLTERVIAGDNLEAAIHAADAAVRKGVETGEGREGMASTIVAARRHEDHTDVAWVGDSRAYLWDGTRLSLLTEDHSLVATLVARGEIDWHEAAHHPHRNVILQALGQEQDQTLKVSSGTYPENQLSGYLLLCSDGLSDMVPPPQLATFLRSIPMDGMDDVADEMIEAALDAGGRDNISLVIVDLGSKENLSPLDESSRVWSFDPVTDEYQGIEAAQPAPQPDGDITRIQPRAVAPAPRREPVSTVTEHKEMRWNRAIIVIAITAVIVAAAIVLGSSR